MDNISFAELLEKLYQLEQFSSSVFNIDEDLEYSRLTELVSSSAIPGLIGKTAVFESNKIYFNGNLPVEFFGNIIQSLKSLEIIISDSRGNIIYNKIVDDISIMKGKFVWTGVNNSNQKTPKGDYIINLITKNQANQEEKINTLQKGEISKMIFLKKGVFFEINNLRVPYDSIIEIYS